MVAKLISNYTNVILCVGLAMKCYEYEEAGWWLLLVAAGIWAFTSAVNTSIYIEDKRNI